MLLTVLLDGRAVRAYVPVYLTDGHAVGPLDPFVTRLAGRIGYDGDWLVLSTGSKTVRVRMKRRDPADLVRSYVALGPLLRALGASVALDRAHDTLSIISPRRRAIAMLEPQAAQVSPRAVFTPAPVATPRPVWTGKPVPRRTPLPLSAWGLLPRR